MAAMENLDVLAFIVGFLGFIFGVFALGVSVSNRARLKAFEAQIETRAESVHYAEPSVTR